MIKHFCPQYVQFIDGGGAVRPTLSSSVIGLDLVGLAAGSETIRILEAGFNSTDLVSLCIEEITGCQRCSAENEAECNTFLEDLAKVYRHMTLSVVLVASPLF